MLVPLFKDKRPKGLYIILTHDGIPIFSCVRCTSDVPKGGVRLHSTGLGHVPRERGAPAGHVQLLHQLPCLLLCLQSVQGNTLKNRQDQKVLSHFL